MEPLYVHVQWPDGTDDMVPEQNAELRAKAGTFKIVDPTPAPFRRFKPRVPLGTSARPKPAAKARPKRNRTTRRVVTEPAPQAETDGAPKAKEATE